LSTALSFLLLSSILVGQEPSPGTIEIYGNRLADAEKLIAIWLYPEDYENKTIRLYGYLFEPQNFEYFSDLNGYLFQCEPVIYGRRAFHPHVGNATFLSREKLNFFCTTAQGQYVRQLFKEHQGDQHHEGEFGLPSEVVLKVEKRNNVYLAVLVSFKHREGFGPAKVAPPP
jgi:hypothetical protein